MATTSVRAPSTSSWRPTSRRPPTAPSASTSALARWRSGCVSPTGPCAEAPSPFSGPAAIPAPSPTSTARRRTPSGAARWERPSEQPVRQAPPPLGGGARPLAEAADGALDLLRCHGAHRQLVGLAGQVARLAGHEEPRVAED